ncbi:MAG: [acyl-carrier-protein] S-malonyltransferase [Phycisphaeraceae bacterium]|nr:[acyl-carrier-protein] S-malonyltransferase [Phycisphaeraceae bacterium]
MSDNTSTDNVETTRGSVLLCPGQGAQQVGMGKAWAECSAAARRTFEQADEALGMPLSRVCFEGPEDRLNRTDVAQAAIYTTSVAAYGALREEGRITQVTATAGLSLGEFTALHLAGAFDFAAGLRLVRLRGQAMQEAAEARAGGMVAVIAPDDEAVEKLCLGALDRVRAEDHVLVPANFNCPRQVVVSGSIEACEATVEVAGEMGITAKPLVVAGAFHSTLMAPAARRLSAALDQVQWSAPSAPVMSNVTGRPHDTKNIESIKGLLVEQLTRPVQWQQCAEWLAAHVLDAQRVPLELEPGKVLAGLYRRIDRRIKVTHALPETATTR